MGPLSWEKQTWFFGQPLQYRRVRRMLVWSGMMQYRYTAQQCSLL